MNRADVRPEDRETSDKRRTRRGLGQLLALPDQIIFTLLYCLLNDHCPSLNSLAHEISEPEIVNVRHSLIGIVNLFSHGVKFGRDVSNKVLDSLSRSVTLLVLECVLQDVGTYCLAAIALVIPPVTVVSLNLSPKECLVLTFSFPAISSSRFMLEVIETV